MTNDRTNGDDAANAPVDKIWEGKLKASIWRNEGERRTFFKATFARTFKDQDGELRDTQSFGSDDLLKLSELARQAHHRTNELAREEFRERRDNQEPDQDRGRGQQRSR